jgi:cation diffusion facilitator family transporter
LSHVPEKCARCGKKVPFITLAGNLGMGAIKCIVGALSGSVGLTVDGFHSLTDAIGTLFVLISLRVAGKSRDASHPYGHGKVEFMASLVVFSVLIGVGGLFFFESISILIEGREKAPKIMGFLVALVSITANYIMFNFNLCAGRRLNSPALIANGYENLTDLCSSIPVGVGIVAAQFGYYFADPLAGVLVAVFIMFNASREWWHSFAKLMDRAAPAVTQMRIRAMAVAVRGVEGTRRIRTRQVGQNLWVDLDILVSAKCSVEKASRIADEVRGHLLRKAKHVEEVVVYCFANGRCAQPG